MTGRVTSPVALENLRNELHPDSVSVLSAVYSVRRLRDGASDLDTRKSEASSESLALLTSGERYTSDLIHENAPSAQTERIDCIGKCHCGLWNSNVFSSKTTSCNHIS